MAFRFTRPPLTQNVVSLLCVAVVAWLVEQPGAAKAWSAYLAMTPPWFHFCGAVLLLHAGVFWAMALFFGYVERTNRPAFIARYRIQSDVKKRPPAKRVAWVLAWNQLFWTPVVLVGIWLALQARGWDRATQLPSAVQLALMLAGMSVLSVVYFYASHRFLHRPWWMRKVHRVHHEFRTSTALAAEYAHWFEFVFGNFGTMGVGVIILAPTLPTIYLYTVLGTYTFVSHHCGFAVPFISSPVHHDWHHFRYVEAFGTYGLLDRLLGTDEEYKTLEHGQEVP